MRKIRASRVREMIGEEIKRLVSESSVDNDVIKTVVNSSIDLLMALDSFESKSTEKQKSAVQSIVDELKRHLTTMRDGASSYVDTAGTSQKRVVFKKTDV